MSQPKSYDAHLSKQRRIVDALVEGILEGQLVPGEALRQDHLAKRFDVSPTPVREALRELVALGLVSHESDRGFYVADLRLDASSEVVQVRALVEPHATRLAAGMMSEETLDELERLNEGFRTAEVEEDIREFNARFHRTIYQAARAPLLGAIIELTWSVFPWKLTMLARTYRQPIALEQHAQIIAALRGGDGDTAASVMREHILFGALAYPEAPPGADTPA